jgi:ferric-dicitrate binding protein FerR (iron transport regulator)
MGLNQKIDQEYYLDRMLSGTLTHTEKKDLRNHIQSVFRDEELNEMMRKHWLELENKEMADEETRLLILKDQFLSRISQVKNLMVKESEIKQGTWINFLLRVAAVLFIPLLLGSLLIFYRMDKQIQEITSSGTIEKIIANPGSRVHFTLPDHSEVWLNSGSMLEYPVTLYHQSSRKVKLYGEGYFKVSHDAKHPFYVETDKLSIKVLGTSFDVSSYDNDQQISATLEEGSIALMDLNGNEITRIHPGQKAALDKNDATLTVRDVETLLTTSWKDGKLIFRNTSLPDVTRQLERWYNCKIHVDPNLLNTDLKYTATIQDETLGEVLKMIEISTKIKTSIEKREVYIRNRN